MGEVDTAERYSRLAVDAYTDETDPEWAFGDAVGSHAEEIEMFTRTPLQTFPR